MKQQTYIHIPEPCHENWNAMTPEGKGRFCVSCAKTVIDFSTMSDAQVLNYLSSMKGNACGRFRDDQLERAMVMEEKRRKSLWQWVLATMATFSLANKINAQTTKGEIKPSISASPKDVANPLLIGKVAYKIMPEEQNVMWVHIGGSVTNEIGEPLPAATIEINDERRVVSDGNGKFSLEMNMKKGRSVKFVISYVGYETQQKMIMSDQLSRPVSIQMKQVITKLDDVIVSAQTVIVGAIRFEQVKSSITDSCKNIVKDTVNGLRNAWNNIVKPTATVTIYPNPAHKGSQVNIKVKDAGDYAIQLLNNNGSFVSQQVQSGIVEKQVLPFSIPSNIAAGNYYLRIINNTTKKQTTEKIIVM